MIDGVGGEGAIWLQWLQLALTLWIYIVGNPSQKIEVYALEIIEDVP